MDPNFALIKGGGGALLREKMVEVRFPPALEGEYLPTTPSEG